MKQHPPQRTALLVFCALVVLGVGLRVWNAFQGLPELLHTTVPDDAFYYFGIARHISLGDPPSIDGYTPTNGYHPLWMAVLVPIYSLVDSNDLVTPIRVALLLGALLDAISTVLIWQITRRIGLGVTGVVLAVGFFVLNPHQVVNATCGLETALALCMLLLAVALYVTARTSEPSTVPNHFRFGLVLGLTVLGRTDHALIAAALFGASAWALFRTAGPRRALTWGASTAAAAVAVYVPWLAYSLQTTGTVVQSSGLALSYLYRQIPRIWGIEQPSFALSAERAWAATLESGTLLLRWLGVSALAAGALALAGFAFAFSSVERRRVLFERMRLLGPFLGGMIVLFFAHTTGRMVFREWYTAPFIAAAALAIGVFGDLLVTTTRTTLASHLLLAGAASAWLWGAASDKGRTIYPYQGPAGTLSDDVREGHSDCGVVSYFTGRGITNLDGIVNQRALEALMRGDLLSYVKSQPFERIYVSLHYHYDVFFGPRYREAFVRHEIDPRAVRVVKDPFEKDVRILPVKSELPLGGLTAREYLGDGWAWHNVERPTITSLGEESELVFYLPRASSDARLDLKLSATVTNPAGFQPVDVFLNEARVKRLEVATAPQFYEVPLRSAVQGRNCLRLRFGHARARRSLSPGWWSTVEGNPVLAVEGYALRFHGGLNQEQHSFSVRDDTLACQGCYPPEGDSENKWRWTNGRARVTLPGLRLETKRECWLRIVARAPSGTYQVSWNGTPLTGTLGTYRVPLEKGGSAAHSEVGIDSPVFVPSERGQAPDTRRLGIALDSVELSCW